jgi:hypothetical protein
MATKHVEGRGFFLEATVDAFPSPVEMVTFPSSERPFTSGRCSPIHRPDLDAIALILLRSP